MDLHPDPLQERLAGAVEAALTRTGGVHAELAAIGVPEIGAPERLGGLGLGLGADIMVHERLGHGLEPPGPLGETLHALDLLEVTDLPESLLGEIFKGTRHAVTIGAHAREAALRLDDGALWGESEILPAGSYGLAVVCMGSGWFIATLEPPKCETEQVTALGMPAVRLRFNGAAARPLTPQDPLLARDAARIRQAALLLGLAERAVEVARAHVNRRAQYGKPLIELQSVSHRLARLVGAADGWRLVLHEAAWRFDRGMDIRAQAARLLAAAAEHALDATRTGMQLHGAQGMLAHSTAATAYRIAAIEAIRLDPPDRLWLAAEQIAPEAPPTGR